MSPSKNQMTKPMPAQSERQPGGHATADTLARYLLDQLDLHARAALEDHVLLCGECASALAAEARFELELRTLVPVAAQSQRRTATIARQGGVIAALAAAMMLVSLAGHGLPGAGQLHRRSNGAGVSADSTPPLACLDDGPAAGAACPAFEPGFEPAFTTPARDTDEPPEVMSFAVALCRIDAGSCRLQSSARE